MRVKRVKQATGARKEVSLEVAGNEAHGSDQAHIYIPTDAEYAYYGELLQGYFKHLARWQGIFEEFQESISTTDETYSCDFIVVQTPKGLAIHSGKDLGTFPERPDIILIANALNVGDFSEGYFLSDISFDPSGSVGNHLLVDAEGENVDRVQIMVNSRLSQAPEEGFSSLRKVSIHAIRPNIPWPHTANGRGNTCSVVYLFQDNTLQVIRGQGVTKPMSDLYAIHLFNTVDALIPGANSPVSQNGRRTTNEQAAPRLSPAPGRRPAGR